MSLRTATHLVACFLVALGVTGCMPPATPQQPSPDRMVGLPLGVGTAPAPLRHVLALEADAFDLSTTISTLDTAVTDTFNLASVSADPADPINFCVLDQGASGWYRISLSETTEVLVTQEGTDFLAGIAIFTRDETSGEWGPVNCTDGFSSFLRFTAEAATPYYIMVTGPSDLNTGTVGLTIRRVVPLEASFTIDPVATFIPGTRDAIVTGTLTTNKPTFYSGAFQMRQKAGHTYITGFTAFGGENNGSVAMSFTVQAFNGYWAGGKAEIYPFPNFNLTVFDQEGGFVDLGPINGAVKLRASR